MSRQDKATTDRNARTLRDLVKQGDNRNCADCKKNDARWASWNLGVYLCIRCSGIHRSMGTHISKVKSIDLDIWQPEQMDSMKKWGNRRANLYWEAYLKAGHHPPDHKIESFIRSKYEARKWALSSRIPSDPSVLEEEGGGQAEGSNGGVPRDEPPRYDPSPVSPRGGQSMRSPTATMTAPPTGPSSRSHPLLSSMAGSKSAAPPMRTKAPEVDLLSGDFGGESVSMPTRTTAAAPAVPGNRPAPPSTSGGQVAPAAPAATPTATAKATPSSSLFDLDFKTPSASATANKTSNQDILSLFSSAPPQPVRQTSFGDFGGFGQAPQPQQTQQQQYQQQPSPQQYQQQSSYQPQQQYSQPQQQQQQQSSSAIYGQSDSYNAPPAVQSNTQAGYASWSSGSGVTSPVAQTSGSSSGAGMGALSTGFAGMKMGNDPWSSAAPAAQPTTTTRAQPSSGNTNNGSNGTTNHFVSSQDVWGGTALPAPILDTGFQFGQGGQPAQKKAVEDDPFQNIWN